MFEQMRRKERQLGQADTIALLEKAEFGILSTLRSDGYPYGIPVNYIYANDAIYFHCALEGSKLKNMQQHEKVAFCVVGGTHVLPEQFTTNYESAVVFGTVAEAGEEEKQMALEKILSKYSPEFMESGLQYIQKAGSRVRVMKITAQNITGKARR